jgi:hypothetical protein
VQARIRDLNPEEIRRRARTGSLRFGVGPFSVGLRTTLAEVTELVALFYRDFPLAPETEFRDYELSVFRPRSLRRWIRPYVNFDGDGERPFEPLGDDLAYPMLEWGFNWRVATTAHQFLMLHAAVLERKGVTVLMPALPGSGKSTLAAALMLSGWRLLSDEFGLIRPGTDAFVPFPRPIPLKNESIEVVRAFCSEATLGPIFRGTRKGDVSHCRPSGMSVERARDEAPVTHLIFPSYETGASLADQSFPRSKAFMKLCGNSFNYEVLGVEGFETVGRIVEKSECHSFVYGDLREAIAWFDGLTASC